MTRFAGHRRRNRRLGFFLFFVLLKTAQKPLSAAWRARIRRFRIAICASDFGLRTNRVSANYHFALERCVAAACTRVLRFCTSFRTAHALVPAYRRTPLALHADTLPAAPRPCAQECCTTRYRGGAAPRGPRSPRESRTPAATASDATALARSLRDLLGLRPRSHARVLAHPLVRPLTRPSYRASRVLTDLRSVT